MAGHVYGGACGIKATNTGAKDPSSSQRGETTNHMDRAVTSKVVDTGTEEESVGLLAATGASESRHPAERRPNPMGHDGVDDADEHEFVTYVGLELATFGDGSRYDGCGGGSESKLEEPAL